jgi:N-methylhydantoinase A
MLEIAVDIGGTFTDIVCLQDQQRLFLAKVPTTPHDLVQGMQQGVTPVLALAGQPATAVERFIHSTTIATNAILEQKGAITGVLMTAGFEDVLEIGRQKRAQMYDLFLDPETPSFLAPCRQRVGIHERLDAQGNILQPLDEPQVIQAIATLQQLYGVQTVIYPSFTCRVDDAGNLLLTLHTR